MSTLAKELACRHIIGTFYEDSCCLLTLTKIISIGALELTDTHSFHRVAIGPPKIFDIKTVDKKIFFKHQTQEIFKNTVFERTTYPGCQLNFLFEYLMRNRSSVDFRQSWRVPKDLRWRDIIENMFIWLFKFKSNVKYYGGIKF